MNRYYVGLTMSDRKFQLFASSWSVERTLIDSGYDLIAGPFNTKQEAEERLIELESYNLAGRP